MLTPLPCSPGVGRRGLAGASAPRGLQGSRLLPARQSAKDVPLWTKMVAGRVEEEALLLLCQRDALCIVLL